MEVGMAEKEMHFLELQTRNSPFSNFLIIQEEVST